MLRENNHKLLKIKTRRLQKLKEEQSLKGLNSPPELLIEIEDLEVEIEQLHDDLNKPPSPITPNSNPIQWAKTNPSWKWISLGITIFVVIVSGLTFLSNQPLYQSNFATGPSGWNVNVTDDEWVTVNRTLKNGIYEWSIFSKKSGMRLEILEVVPVISDFDLQANIKQVNGEIAYGLVFRETQKGYYIFYIYKDTFRLSAYTYGKKEWESILTPRVSSAIKVQEWNTLRVIANGSSIQLYINGQVVGSVKDDKFDEGQVGIAVVPGDKESSTYEIDMFKVYLLQ